MGLQNDQLLALMAAVLASNGRYTEIARGENLSAANVADYFVDIAAELLQSAEDKYSGKRE